MAQENVDSGNLKSGNMDPANLDPANMDPKIINEGMKAPDFTLKDTFGKVITLSGFIGKKVVLYFYPADDTPGCTAEACSFRDVYDDILALDAVVIGISPDKESSHEKFRNKYNLPFHLLCDEDHKIADIYNAWGEKKIYGRIYEGILRKTYIINESGVITHIFNKVTTEGHGAEVLKILQKS